MSKPKILFLTSLSTEINEKGQERIEKINLKVKDDDEDSPPKQGSAKWFREMGIEPPKDLEEEQEDLGMTQDGFIELEDDELEYIHNEVILERSEFESAEDSLNGLTLVTTKSGRAFEVLENTDDIFGQIYMLDQTWFERNWDDLKFRAKRIFKKEKDLVLELPQKENNQ